MTLKQLRTKRGLTLEQLSVASKVGLSTIGNYENGKTSISEESLKKIAAALDVSPDTLRDPVSRLTEVLSSQRERGGFRMEDQVVEEVRARIEQFPLSDARTRQLYVKQILQRLTEYGEWCEGHYNELHLALLAEAKSQEAASTATGTRRKEKRARLRDIATISLAIFGSLPAGWPDSSDSRDNWQAARMVRVKRGRWPEGAFGLDVRGDSMNAAQPEPILDGDTVVLVSPEEREPKSGDIVAALIDGETCLKRLVNGKVPAHLKSESTNPAHGALHPLRELIIQGVVVGKL